LPGRIERQHGLEALDGVQDEKAADMEEQHADRIDDPALLAPRVDAARPVDRGLDRPQHGREEGVLAVEDARHVAAEQGRDRDDDRAKENDLGPADEGHCRSALKAARAAAAHRRGRS
jgi:hypothetical protein